MATHRFDFSPRGRARVLLLTFLGTICCIAVAFTVDSYSIENNSWRWGDRPLNNLVIPLILAPPFFYFLLNKLRELAIAHQELLVVSATDSLTSCLNRRAFTALVDSYLQRFADRQTNAESALLVIDVDHFKAVNDRFGHDLGDEALKIIAKTIRDEVRERDFVGRLGGEEFCVFLPGFGLASTAIVAERIRAAVNRAEFAPTGEQYTLSVSVGGVTFKRTVLYSELYRQADRWLYSAKRNGRNRVEIQQIADADRGYSPSFH
ncbi:diguanylate cyclase (GGDEF) domain-containing protein [Mesorhizobium albiziae]|uniref:diguanylate cyclase n=1 Tax=Neomesorhizobium albiziae TaxID=335020 RepID=A0A1I4EEB3_9HYPH|nr:GGDEF domain-containing protein [Mesorhizobium albiziae]GLS33534.1 GGDEF domain-containing protein [Mesorhizobium albiziae]SFL03549.1 diguanylate cyclase (GGDEF) domain-containing protein [Mesorhizobium albiziae]